MGTSRWEPVPSLKGQMRALLGERLDQRGWSVSPLPLAQAAVKGRKLGQRRSQRPAEGGQCPGGSLGGESGQVGELAEARSQDGGQGEGLGRREWWMLPQAWKS